MNKKTNKINENEHSDPLSMFRPSKYFDTYVKLTTCRSIFITEDFSKEMAGAMTALLLHLDNESNEDIQIYIHSNGGDAAALTNIYDVLQIIKSPISTICLGKAYSAGAFLLAAGTKGKRLAMEHSEIMLHSIQCLFPLPSKEHPIDAKSYYEFLKTVNNGVLDILVKHTGNTLEKIKEDCSKDFFLTAKEAKAYGIIDDIL